MDFDLTDSWHETFPGAHIGVLLVGDVDNSVRDTPLEARKREIEADLRTQFAGRIRADLLELDVLGAYHAYYRRFDQTYHVQLQLESVVFKGKPLPNITPLVDANFMAELQTFVLTAGHDVDLLRGGLRVDVTRGGEAFTQLGGKVRTLKAGDMSMADETGIVCTVLHGQDAHTPISAQTRRALYVAYAPAGVPVNAVHHQLEIILMHVRLFAPDAVVEHLEVRGER